MAETRTLIWEIGCEELPAWACEQARRQLPELLTRALQTARLAPESGPDLKVWVGPRRMTARAEVLPEQPARTSERRGPIFEAAFDADGAPTKACAGFAASAGLEPGELEVREDESGKKFVWARVDEPAGAFTDAFGGVAEDVIRGLNFGKLMRWGTGEHRFVRPVRWMVTLLDASVVPHTILGVESGRTSSAHRFLGEARTIEVGSADSYVHDLEGGYVVVDHDARAAAIRSDLDDHASEAGGSWFDPGNVLDEVVHLVESPSVLVGRFDESYLELPERVLVTAMQSHQRYLPVRAPSGKLAPSFLVVMNGDPAAANSILPGYERVLAGRLDDAVFSFERDRERGIEDMASSLGDVVFHAKAGSLADRTERLRALGATLASAAGADASTLDAALRLSKADQVSILVQEFAELEGFAGARYAETAGLDEGVCAAIEQQFLPRGPRSALPDAGLPSLVAIADKADLLVTAFAIGEEPTGSRDPHGLRRAAAGIVRIVAEHDIPVDLDALISAAADALARQGFGDTGSDLRARVRAFVDDRIEKDLTGAGTSIEAVRAARAAGLPQVQHIVGLARALDAGRRADDERFAHVLTAYTRSRNILAKASPEDLGEQVLVSLLDIPAEQKLNVSLEEHAPQIEASVAGRDFTAAVDAAAALGPAVDAFFDREHGVMVMDDEQAVRRNRLALLEGVLAALKPLGDLSHL